MIQSNVAADKQATMHTQSQSNSNAGDVYCGGDSVVPTNQYYTNISMYPVAPVGTQFFSNGHTSPITSAGQLYPITPPGGNIDTQPQVLQRQRLTYDQPRASITRWPPTHYPAQINDFEQQYVSTPYSLQNPFVQSFPQQYSPQYIQAKSIPNPWVSYIPHKVAFNESYLEPKSSLQNVTHDTGHAHSELSNSVLGFRPMINHGKIQPQAANIKFSSTDQKLKKQMESYTKRVRRPPIPHFTRKSSVSRTEGHSLQIQNINDVAIRRCHSEPILWQEYIEGSNANCGIFPSSKLRGYNKTDTGGAHKKWSDKIMTSEAAKHSSSSKRKQKQRKKKKKVKGRLSRHSLTRATGRKIRNSIAKEKGSCKFKFKGRKPMWLPPVESDCNLTTISDVHIKQKQPVKTSKKKFEHGVCNQDENINKATPSNTMLKKQSTPESHREMIDHGLVSDVGKPRILTQNGYKWYSSPSLLKLQVPKIESEDSISVNSNLNPSITGHSLSEATTTTQNSMKCNTLFERELTAALPARSTKVHLQKYKSSKQLVKPEESVQFINDTGLFSKGGLIGNKSLCVQSSKSGDNSNVPVEKECLSKTKLDERGRLSDSGQEQEVQIQKGSKKKRMVRSTATKILAVDELQIPVPKTDGPLEYDEKLIKSKNQHDMKYRLENSVNMADYQGDETAVEEIKVHQEDAASQRRTSCDIFRDYIRGLLHVRWWKEKTN